MECFIEMGRRAVCAAVALGALAAAAPAEGAPALRLQDRDPVIVAGNSFKRGEQIRVTLIRETSASRVVRASRRGAFVVTFAGASVSRCDFLRVVATGGGGSRATLKILPSPACLPQRSQ